MNKSFIQSIIPFNDLTSLDQSDIDNDIQILLSWLLQPTLLLDRISEPSQRIKFAIRTCLKDDIQQFEFMNLYMNTIVRSIYKSIQSTEIDKKSSLVDIIHVIKKIINFYQIQFNYLNLSDSVKKVFQDKINSQIKFSLESSSLNFTSLIYQFFETNLFRNSLVMPNLDTLNLIDIISTLININMATAINEIAIDLATMKIRLFTNNLCSLNWEEQLLDKILNLIQFEIYPDFLIILNYTQNVNLTNEKYLNELIKVSHLELIKIRIKEIHEIVLDYPTSKISLVELNQCLTNYNDKTQRVNLTTHFIEDCQTNLLHAGVNTIDIITMYTKTIESFLIIDPKGVLLDRVIRPIRHYLKSRYDVIPILVAGLLDTDKKTNPLHELALELRQPKNAASTLSYSYQDSVDLNWNPDPIDALPDFKKEKITDIIESLISIFDSKDAFLEEFTKFFSQKLISLDSIDDIETNLNLLKVKFGKSNFINLDIMIKDIRDSYKLNSGSSILKNSVLSHLYWSSILDNINEEVDNYEIPNEIRLEFDKFNESFKQKKQGRFLKLVPSLGVVDLDVEFRNGDLKRFRVGTDKASILKAFDEEQNEISVDYIAEKLKMSNYLVQKGLEFWVKEGVLLQLTQSLYVVNED